MYVSALVNIMGIHYNKPSFPSLASSFCSSKNSNLNFILYACFILFTCASVTYILNLVL